MEIVVAVVVVAAFVGFVYWRVTKSNDTTGTSTSTGTGDSGGGRGDGGNTQEY